MKMTLRKTPLPYLVDSIRQKIYRAIDEEKLIYLIILRFSIIP